jgi:hypothetical protein
LTTVDKPPFTDLTRSVCNRGGFVAERQAGNAKDELSSGSHPVYPCDRIEQFRLLETIQKVGILQLPRVNARQYFVSFSNIPSSYWIVRRCRT